MTTRFSFDVACQTCGTRGIVFWSEGGGMDAYERVSGIWGAFREIGGGPRLLGGRQLGEIACTLCGGAAEHGYNSSSASSSAVSSALTARSCRWAKALDETCSRLASPGYRRIRAL